MEAAVFVLIFRFTIIVVLWGFLRLFLHVLYMEFFLKVALADKTAVLFTKDGDQHNNLHDMQCMWSVCLIIVTKSCFK